MKKIRIGKDILIEWTILTGGEPRPLAGRDLTLVLTDQTGKSRVLDIKLTHACQLAAMFPGTEQHALGDYTLTLWENRGKEGQSAVDAVRAFRLVRTTVEETEGDGASCTCGSMRTVTIHLGSASLELLTSANFPEATVDNPGLLSAADKKLIDEMREFCESVPDGYALLALPADGTEDAPNGGPPLPSKVKRYSRGDGAEVRYIVNRAVPMRPRPGKRYFFTNTVFFRIRYDEAQSSDLTPRQLIERITGESNILSEINIIGVDTVNNDYRDTPLRNIPRPTNGRCMRLCVASRRLGNVVHVTRAGNLLTDNYAGMLRFLHMPGHEEGGPILKNRLSALTESPHLRIAGGRVVCVAPPPFPVDIKRMLKGISSMDYGLIENSYIKPHSNGLSFSFGRFRSMGLYKTKGLTAEGNARRYMKYKFTKRPKTQKLWVVRIRRIVRGHKSIYYEDYSEIDPKYIRGITQKP